MIEIVYYELKQKKFRSKKALKKFLNTKLDNEILRVLEKKKGIYKRLEINNFLFLNKYEGYENEKT